MSKYTPGPWMVATSCSWRRIVTELTNEPVCVPTTSRHDGHPDLIAKSDDLRLIAAAPDLLTSAREALSAMESIWQTRGMDDEWIYDEMGSELSSGYFSLRAAIAKATGES